MILDLSTQIYLLCVGFGIGALVGLTGVGGGALMTPILILFFRIPPSIAVGTDLVNAAIMKSVGAFQHWRQGTVRFDIVRLLATGSLPAAILGVGIVKILKDQMGSNGESILTLILAWTLVLVATLMILRLIFVRREKKAVHNKLDPKRITPNSHRTLLTVLLGAITGILVSLTSVGAGSIVMIILMILYSASAKRLVGTDLVHAALLAAVSALGHLLAGTVNLSVAAILLMGSLPGVWLGSRLVKRLPDLALRIVLAVTLMFTGMRLLAP